MASSSVPPVKPQRVLVVTGAGISAESGIPTFRGAGGYWRNLNAQQLATATAFHQNPELVWDWYRERRDGVRQARPNAAHRAIVKLARETPEFLLLTQNVDDLHERAEWNGQRLPRTAIVKIHGDLFITRCTRCEYQRRDEATDAPGVPRCPHCKSPLRPGVVWFGEELPRDELRRIDAFVTERTSDLVYVIGTTATFGYILDWAQAAAGRQGRLVEINPQETQLSPFVNEAIREPAAAALPRLLGMTSSGIWNKHSATAGHSEAPFRIGLATCSH